MTDRVIIGVDPHKLSVTFEARDSREMLRATGRFGTDARSYRQLLAYARQWPERVWAVEGANDAQVQKTGPGGHSGATLLSSAADLPPGIGTSDQLRARGVTEGNGSAWRFR